MQISLLSGLYNGSKKSAIMSSVDYALNRLCNLKQHDTYKKKAKNVVLVVDNVHIAHDCIL